MTLLSWILAVVAFGRLMYDDKMSQLALDAAEACRAKLGSTLGEPWLDDVDVDDNGQPQPGAQTLAAKLAARGLGPTEAELTFIGVVTNRCVASV